MEVTAIDNSKTNTEPFLMYDNCVHPDDQQKIHDAVFDSNFNWSFNKHTASEFDEQSKLNLNIYETPQFVHPLIDSKGLVFSAFNYISDIIINSVKTNLEMEIEEVDRMKINYLHANPNFKHGMYHTPHCDKHLPGKDDENWISVIYYVNDADGDTYFFNKFWGEETLELRTISQCPPKKGRLIMFHSTRYHASSCPVDTDRRVIVNSVFKVKENS